MGGLAVGSNFLGVCPAGGAAVGRQTSRPKEASVRRAVLEESGKLSGHPNCIAYSSHLHLAPQILSVVRLSSRKEGGESLISVPGRFSPSCWVETLLTISGKAPWACWRRLGGPRLAVGRERGYISARLARGKVLTSLAWHQERPD